MSAKIFLPKISCNELSKTLSTLWLDLPAQAVTLWRARYSRATPTAELFR